MATLPNRTRTLAILDRLRDILRANLGTEIAAANLEPPVSGGSPALTLPALADATAQIKIGDHEAYAPNLETYPIAVRVGFGSYTHRGFSSRGIIDITATFPIAVYVSSDATSPAAECVEGLIAQTLRLGLAYSEAVRACVEKYAPSTTYGARVYTRAFERDEGAPQNPDRPCKIYERFVITLEFTTRARQSGGAA